MRRVALALASVLACALPALAQDTDQPGAPTPAPRPDARTTPPQDTAEKAFSDKEIATPPAAPFDFASRATQQSYEAEVRRLVAAYPTRLRVASLGQSRGGRELVMLTAGDLSAGDPDKRPAVLVVTALEPGVENRPAGPEAALFAARALLEKAAADPASAAWLTRTTVYFLPAADPDPVFAAEGAAPRACRLDRNFPSDWKPWNSASCAQGPYPLSEPETQACARALASRQNVGAVLLLARSSSRARATSETSEWERILCRRILATEAQAEASAEASDALASLCAASVREPGSLAAYCRARLSAFVLPFDPFTGAVVETSVGRAQAGFAATLATLEKLGNELPQLTSAVTKTERLRERLWLVDVDLQNLGLLPTVGASERERCPGSVWLESTGGRIAQVGIARAGASDVNAVKSRPDAWSLGHLDGRESVRLHILVEAAEGTRFELSFRTLRQSEASCGATLR